MSEQEFDLYLSLLSRFLRLSSRQRAAIADELRDHLETRLEELTGQGLSREQAIRAALEEFGDAAELADHFGKLAQARRRRIIMRLSAGSAVALTAGILFVFAMWPENPAGVGPQLPRVLAQAEPTKPATAEQPIDSTVDRNLIVEQKLDETIDGLEFVEQPLADVLQSISTKHKVQIVPDWDTILNEGVERDSLVTFGLSNVRFSTALDLLFDKHNLAYAIRDGVLVVTTRSALDEGGKYVEVRVYNCRDLVELTGPFDSQVKDAKGHTESQRKDATEAVIRTIRALPGTQWEEDDGVGGEINSIGGVLIIAQTEPVHRRIKKLLTEIRGALEDQRELAQAPVAIP